MTLVGEPGDAKHDEREANEPEEVACERSFRRCAECGIHHLSKMIRGKNGCHHLEGVWQELERHPKAGEKAHGQVDEVRDAACGCGRHEECHGEAEAGEWDCRERGDAKDMQVLRQRDVDVAEGDAEQGEDGHDDEREDDGHAGLGKHVGERRHGTCLLQFHPPSRAVESDANTDAEDGRAERSEDSVAAEQILGDVDCADGLVAIHHEAEEAIKHDGEADGGKRKRAGTERADDFITHLREEDAEGVGRGGGDDGQGSGGGHGWLR